MPLVKQIKRFVPGLDYRLSKGDCGRIGVVGGSIEYTGAPYFAAIAALKTVYKSNQGADLCHVFCSREASQVIKSYSPELIVHPYLYGQGASQLDVQFCLEKIRLVLDRIDVLIIGPGLSRDPVMLDTATEIILMAKQLNMPLILDADALFIVQKDRRVIDGYPNIILTPNVNEFQRLRNSVGIRDEQDRELACRLLSKAYGGVTILQKGESDIIACGDKVISCAKQGSPRRCGGQGDILTGCLATLLAWGSNSDTRSSTGSRSDLATNIPYLCGYGASRLLREASYYTFREKGRCMVTSDIINNIGPIFTQIFESTMEE